ncbi:MAG: hypothetical protein ACKVX7_14725 [Planctomycetota bacterium]
MREQARKQQQEQQKQQGAKQEPKDPGESPNNESARAENPKNEIGELRARSGQGRWGRLPPSVVEQMYDNGRRKLPMKYQVLLEEYFRRLPATEKK